MAIPYVDPSDIVKCCKETVKLTDNSRFYLSILTMKNLLGHKEGYQIESDPRMEKEECQGGEDCYLYRFRDLKNVIVMTLNVEKGGVRTKFEIRSFAKHCYQNCEVTAMYLKYLYLNCKHVKHNRFNDNVIKNSNKLYRECASDFDESGYGPRDKRYVESDSTVGVKKILLRNTPVVKGLPFSDVLKLGINNNPVVASNNNFAVANNDINLLDDGFDLDGFVDQITALQEENEDLKSKNELLLKTLEDKENTVTKLTADLNAMSTKFKKIQVVLGALKNKK